MRKVQLRDAKSGLSAIVDDAVNGEAAIITRHGKPQAVLLGYEEWLRLSEIPSFARLLLAVPDAIDELPTRTQSPARNPDL